MGVGRGAKLVILDTCVVKNAIIKEDKEIKEFLKQIIAEINGLTNQSRYMFRIFSDEIERKILERIEKGLRECASFLFSFSVECEVFSYGTRKNNLYGRCGKMNVREIRRHFGVGVDENCSKEVESDAFLLITACAEVNGYKEIILVTHDAVACDNLERAIGEVQLEKRVKVHCRWGSR